MTNERTKTQKDEHRQINKQREESEIKTGKRLKKQIKRKRERRKKRDKIRNGGKNGCGNKVKEGKRGKIKE